MKKAQLAVSCLLLCSFSSADLCLPFRNCQDQRIEDIVSVWNQSNFPKPSTESDTPFRLQVVWKQTATALYGFSNHVQDDCGYEYSVELISDHHLDHGSISGFIIQACANDHPVGQFVSLDTDTGWQPAHCLQTNDTALYNSAFAKKSFLINWIAPCRSKDIIFRYAVLDSLGHFHKTMEYSYSQTNPTELAVAQQAKNAFHKERIKRASPAAHLIFASQAFIQQLSLDGTRSTVLASGFHLQNAVAIDFHYRQGHIFWTDVAAKTIVRSNLDGSMIMTILDTGLNITDGLAVDWATDKVYWTDAELRRIGVFDLTNHYYNRELISTGTDSLPRAIVVDPQNSEAITICNFSGSAVDNNNCNVCQTLATLNFCYFGLQYESDRWMYWTDWGTVAKIEKASMDGSNRSVIHSTNLIWPNALTLDYVSQVLYWADAFLDKIESSDVDGSNRRVIVTTGVYHPFGITLFEDKLYFSDWIGDISSTNKSGESSVQILYHQTYCSPRPNGIQVFSEQRQLPAPNKCDNNNGNCSHLCLLSVTDPREFTCACPEGMSLEANMLSCIAIPGTALPPSPPSEGTCAAAGFSSCCIEGPCQGQPMNCYCDANCYQFGDCCTDVPADCLSAVLNPYMMVAMHYFIRQLSLDGNRTSIAASGLTNANALDFDYRKSLLFWTDVDEGKIWMSQLDGSGAFSIVESGIGVLEGIAVDWINTKLYWTDTEMKTVEVLDLSGGYHTALISTGIGSSSMPRAIVVDPQTRWMYWTDWGTIPKIEKASMDGSNRSVIHSTNLIWPNALALDYPAQVLYWGDARLDKIESSNVDGSNRRVIVSTGVYHPFGITLFEDKLYFSDWEVRGILLTNKSGGQGVQPLTTNSLCPVASGIQIIAEERQPQGQNPCGSDNGGCSHLCLLSAVDPRGFSCACPDGMTLQEDRQNCTVLSVNGTTPILINAGSCRAANYTECCTSGACEGEPQNCFCDALCHTLQDCCGDAIEFCPPPGIILEFDERPESVSVVPLSSVNFQCSVHASPFGSTIVWLYRRRESSSIQTVGDDTGSVSSKYSVSVGMGSSVLTVHNVDQSDEGSYICMVTAREQSINASAQLHIIVLPVVTGNHTVGELGMISLQCSYAGGPRSMIVWLKRSEEEVKIVLNSSRVLVTHQRQTSGNVHVVTSNLTVHNVSTVDGGEYLCEATNGISEVSNTVSNYINVTAKNECTSEINYPCQYGGTCVDLVGHYECLCTSMYTGINCSERVNATRTTEPSITRPPQSVTAQLVQSINLTCEAESYPSPTYKWYKDGQLIPGETLPYLYIPEASPEDRGNYSCEASNTGGQASSNLAQIAIPGVHQYRVQVNQTGTEDLLQGELLEIVGTTLSMNSSATIYSIQVLNTTSSSSQGREATYIFTMRQPSNEGTPSALVRRNLYERLQSFATFQVLEITRYDGCPAETTTLNTDDISFPYSWPDAEIGSTLFQPCPCQDIVGSLSGNTSRQCAGTYSNGGSWSQADYSQCAILSSEVTGHLCTSALGVSRNPLNVSREVAAVTTENLTPTDVSAATFIVEQLTQEAVRNSQVTQNYLQIVDKLQLADDETLLSSQAETNSSSRLLNSLATFSDEVEISPNTSTRRAVYALQNFALQVQDVNLTAFTGETFSVDLGSVEEAINNTHTINQSALVTMMEALSNATASAQIPNSVFDSCGNQETLTNQINYHRANRLSYIVFWRSGLFQASNTNNVQSSNVNDSLLGNANNSIGSVILGVRRRCAQNFTPLSDRGLRTPREAPLNGSLEIPVQLQFRISQIMLERSRSSSCVHWDVTQNGGFGAWSADDCREVVTGSGNEKVCECTQLAHFGILFDLSPKRPSPAAALALSVLTYIGLSISLLCLLALLVTYLSAKKLRMSIHGQVLINLSLSLMGLYIFFLTGAHLTYVPVLCGISSALLHYFMLVFFGWTTVEAILLYVKLVIIIGTHKIESRFILKAALGTWLVPLLIVAVSAGAGHDYYVNPFYCRATQWPFWFGLILPFVLLYIINWVMFIIIILVSVVKHNTAHSKDAGTRKLFKRNFVIAVGLAIVFGLGWGLGLIATSSSEEGVTLAFQIVFTLFVALQGLLLFAFHGIRNKDARQLWKEWCYATCVKSYKAYSASRSVAVPSVAGKGSTLPSSVSTDSAGFSTLGRQGAAKVKSVESESQAETSLDMSSCDTVLETEHPAYGEVQKQQQGTQQASPRYVEGQHQLDQAEPPPTRRRSRKRSWLQSIVSSGKIDYQEIDDCTSTPPLERKELSADNSDEASAQPRKPRKSWITPFTSQSYMYEALPESAENPPTTPSKSHKKVSTSKLPKREHGTDDRQQESIILEDEAEDEA